MNDEDREQLSDAEHQLKLLRELNTVSGRIRERQRRGVLSSANLYFAKVNERVITEHETRVAHARDIAQATGPKEAPRVGPTETTAVPSPKKKPRRRTT